MEPFDLQEYLKNPSRKVVTRGGKNARIICTDAISENPIIALVTYFDEEKNKIQEATLDYRSDGKYCNEETNYDLVFAPSKNEGWINIYKDNDACNTGLDIFKTREEAVRKGKKSKIYVTTIKIEWKE